MQEPRLHPRFAAPRLIEALSDTPVVLIHGPRQCGKTTLARTTGDPRGYTYFTFDDDVALAAAEADPAGFVADLPERAILDEVQRAPALFPPLKSVVDRRRTPGRFLLTGSAHVLMVPKLADSLAGRIEILRLHPLAQCERANLPGESPGSSTCCSPQGSRRVAASAWGRDWRSASWPEATRRRSPGGRRGAARPGTATTSRR